MQDLQHITVDKQILTVHFGCICGSFRVTVTHDEIILSLNVNWHSSTSLYSIIWSHWTLYSIVEWEWELYAASHFCQRVLSIHTLW